MKKKRLVRCSRLFFPHRKLLRAGLLILFTFLIKICPVNAAVPDIQYITINFSSNRVTLTEVLDEITKQTGLKPFFSNTKVDVNKTVEVKNGKIPLEDLLLSCLDADLKFEIKEGNIIIRKVVQVGQQTKKTITGTVKDLSGEPLVGASVLVKDTKISVLTDSKGAFSIVVPAEAKFLVISFIGMKNTEVATNDNIVSVVLEDLQNVLDEVVVIGYGTAKKRDVTDAIKRVDGEIFKEVSSNSIADVIQGQVAGMQVWTGSNAPGEPSTILLRGVSSLSGSVEPLIVIDDVPMSAGYNILDINPADVESLDILKGASSTAIYGSRAASGVIIITTKKGGVGKPSVDYKYTIGSQSLVSKLDVLTGPEFKFLVMEAIRNQAWEQGITDVTTNANYKKVTAAGYFGEYETPWMDLLYQQAISQIHNFTIKGGTADNSYYAGFGYTNEIGMIKGQDYKKYNLTVNYDTKLSKIVKFGISIRGNQSLRNAPISSFSAIKRMRPDIKAYNDDGTLYFHTYLDGTIWRQTYNALIIAEECENSQKTLGYTASGYLDISPIKGLVFKTLYSTNFTNTDTRLFYSRKTSVGNGYSLTDAALKGKLTEGNRKNTTSLIEFRLTYNTKIGKNHSFDFLASTSFDQQSDVNKGLTFNNFADDYILNQIYQASTFESSNGYEKISALNSYLARVNYRFKNNYLLTASIRSDGSSRFAEKFRFGTFPSVALAWVISEEKFMKSLNKYVPYLKLRMSAGKTGMAYVDEYGWRTLYDSPSTTTTSTIWMGKPGIVPSQIGNDLLRWENTMQYDLGLDFNIAQSNILTGTLGFYLKNVDGLIYPLTLAPSTGLSSTKMNVASIQNKGVEFELTANIINKPKTKWSFSFNIAKNINKVSKLGQEFVSTLGSNSRSSTVLQEGKPIGLFYGYRTDGVFHSWEEIAYYESLSPDSYYKAAMDYPITPGDIKFLDLNGDGRVDFTTNVHDDKTILGNYMPDYSGGIRTIFSHGNFTFNLLATYSIGNDKAWTAYQDQFYFSTLFENNLSFAMNRWTPENPTTDNPKMKVRSLSLGFSDYDIYDASYLKIQNISLNYRMPKKLTSLTRILKDINISASVENVYTFTRYPGPNPDSYNSSSVISGGGIDNTDYPKTRTYSISISASF